MGVEFNEEIQNMSRQRLFENVIGSISVVLIEIEILLAPLWLGHAVLSRPDPAHGYLHIWFFICWWSLACYIGVERVIGSSHRGEDGPAPYTLIGVLTSAVVYSAAVAIGILSAEVVWETTTSVLLSLTFSIVAPIWFLKSLELFGFNHDRADKTKGEV